MENLLKISTIPAEYKLSVQHARLERSKSSPPLLELSREKGGLRMKSKRAQLKLDSYEARNSVVPTLKRSISQAAQKGIEAARQLAGRYSKEASQMRWSKPGEGKEMLNNIFAQRIQAPTGDFQLSFIPAAPVNITYQEGNLSTDYNMDRLSFDLKLNNSNVEYIPGKVEIVMTQYPDVKIEYIGDPMYVPPSAADRFLGKQLDVTA